MDSSYTGGMKYTHRNGETIPPTIDGDFWFDGEGRRDGAQMYTVRGKVFVVRNNDKTYVSGRATNGEPVTFLATEMRGQWWGPVVPPWEQS